MFLLNKIIQVIKLFDLFHGGEINILMLNHDLKYEYLSSQTF